MVSDAQSNEPVAPYMLKVGQLITVSDMPDPAKGGALGRTGKIVAINYDHNSRTASLELDNARDWIYALSTRLRAAVGTP